MKKLVALFLTLGLLLACTPAFALVADDVFGAFDQEDRGHWNPPYDHSAWKKMVGFDLKQDAVLSANVYDEQGGLFNVLLSNQAFNAGYVTINWPAVDMNGWHADAGVKAKYTLIVTAEINGEQVEISVPYEIIYSHSFSDHFPNPKWYPHNTICVAGIEFRDVRPELTKKWYNFAAIDLSQDGVQTYDLVASNMYVIGTVTVAKAGDEVTVDWKLRHQGTNDSNFQSEGEFLTFFSDLDAVTEVEPGKFEGPTYEFGQPISIANDLNGDTNVLLYINNQATYCTNLSYKYLQPIYHAPYMSDTNARIAQRNAMAALMAQDVPAEAAQ